MFADFADPSSPQRMEADLCIVGSGAAGITLANEFIGHACTVLVIESGTVSPEAWTTDLYHAEMAPGGKVHEGVHEGRARVFGGTTTLWGGQALPLSPIDFERRDWVADSGWPFSSEELAPYQERAGALLGLRDVSFDEDIHRAFGIRRPDFDPALVKPIYSRWSPRPNFATSYRRRLASAGNVTVLLHANVTQIVPTSDCTGVETLEIKSIGGRSGTVRAKTYVLCCGGIETPRLLLASNRHEPAGIGNAHGLVGRYFQDHLSVRWADFLPDDRARIDAVFNSFFRGRTKYYPLLSASGAFQRRERILNVSVSVLSDLPADSGIELFKRLFRAVRARQRGALSRAEILTLLRRTPEILHFAHRVLVARRSYADARSPLFLGSTVEQEPNFHSRVRLGDTVDALGMPRAVLDWRLTPLVHRTLLVFAGRLCEEFRRVGLGTVKIYPWLREQASECHGRMHDVYHHIGTARMHTDPLRGVVDSDCRVHGLRNLYIASSAVFPTGGHSNPTFTLLLLCLRLADRLKGGLSQADL